MPDAVESPPALASPRLLFVPVSGPFGMGEYARSLAIAQGAAQRWPRAAVHFLVSRHAPYAAATPFPHTLLDASPTRQTTAVLDVLAQWRPDLVVFDNAGRTAQLAAAKQQGARIVFISARRRQRTKAFRLRWMRLLDEHWIAYPEFIAGELNLRERLKLRLLGRPTLRYLDVILARGAPAPATTLDAGGYVLVVPGGGTGHPGAFGAVDSFFEAARRLADSGLPTVFVGPLGAADANPRRHSLCVRGPLPQAELATLMRGARLIVANGGSTLLQCVACLKPCIAVAIAGDQSARIRRCVAAGVAVAAPLDAVAIAAQAGALWRDPAACAGLTEHAAALHLADGVEAALRAIAALLTVQ